MKEQPQWLLLPLFTMPVTASGSCRPSDPEDGSYTSSFYR